MKYLNNTLTRIMILLFLVGEIYGQTTELSALFIENESQKIDKNGVLVTFTLRNEQSFDKSITDFYIHVENMTSNQSVYLDDNVTSNFSIASGGVYTINSLQILTNQNYNALPLGSIMF